MADMRLLADIGGTNVRFALLSPGSVVPESEASYRCADFRSLEHAILTYLASLGRPPIKEAAFDIAAAITGDFIKLTNSPWAFSVEQTRRALALDRLLVLNDFTALARALPLLASEELSQVGGGEPMSGAACALIGPGTGLGVSGLLPCRSGWVAIEGEGGHVALATMNEREDAVLGVLRQRYGHVSAERVISGPGLVNLYEALCTLDRVVARALKPEAVTEAGIQGSDPQCAEALQMFCALFGTVAANLAVTLGAKGGVYIGGGILPRLGDYFRASPFRSRFEHKGRFSQYAAQIPVWIILADNPALRGLAAALGASD